MSSPVEPLTLVGEAPTADEQQEATNEPPPTAPTAPAEVPVRDRARPKKPLPTSRIAFGKQLDLLRAWANASGPSGKVVTNRDVAGIVSMSADTVSLANTFFSAMGLLQKADGGYLPGQPTLDFNSAYEWTPETAAQKLAPTLRDAWFAEALLPSLKQRPMPKQEALAKLGAAASVGQTYAPQLGLLLDFLEVAGLIEREGETIRAARSEPHGEAPAAEPNPAQATPERKDQHVQRSGGAGVTTSFSQQPEGQIQFNVSFRVSMAEIAGWQPERITAFFGGIAAVLAAKGGVEQDATNLS